jgi:prepilin-type N-terminal cleavage/methylation domain-containing protein/prepilin-type processing-associated H-X9-DG protein
MALRVASGGVEMRYRQGERRRIGRGAFMALGLRGFTLVELLVVIAIIAILAALLLPVLSRAQYNAKTTTCRSNERQQILALVLYTDNDGVYPPYYWGTNSWQDFIGIPRFVMEGSGANSITRCPLNKGYRWADGTVHYPDGPAYAYNNGGILGLILYTPPLGLGGAGTGVGGGALQRATKSSEVVAPSALLALGDGADRSPDPGWDGYLASGFFEPYMKHDQRINNGQPLPAGFVKDQPSYQSHHGRFNRAYADGHVETEDFNRALNDSDDYWRRYNIDNLAHQDLWLQASQLRL